MNNQDIDFTEDFKEVEARTKNINEKLKLYKNKALELQHQLELRESSVRAAEQRARDAEERAEEAEANYKKALDLKQGQYEQLIHDLFEAPQKELTDHMEAHSKHSYRTTMITAVGSIIISLIVSLVFQIQSSNSTNNLIARMEDSRAALEESQQTTKDLFHKLDLLNESVWEADATVKKLAQIIHEEEKTFNNYQSENDIALLFKMRMNSKTADVKYDDFIKAFTVSGKIKKELRPDEDKLRNWDIQFMELCKKAVASLKLKTANTSITNTSSRSKTDANANVNATVSISNREKQYYTYKVESDDTNYGEWGFNTLSTYDALVKAFQNELDSVEKRINVNK
ncbi:MAG: hypothetical protein M3384_13150 [Acidobacteriota bacterium]|nr:hypothetical protein [Acidobacteriota bacterium]